MNMWAAGPGVEHLIKQDRCTASCPSYHTEISTGIRGSKRQQKRGKRTWERDQEIDTIRDRVRCKNRDTEEERCESET